MFIVLTLLASSSLSSPQGTPRRRTNCFVLIRFVTQRSPLSFSRSLLICLCMKNTRSARIATPKGCILLQTHSQRKVNVLD
uniref:Putative secreted protein n=1 Tax=Anopheles triannulatus TaxID=58253 RepID=A0A2M4B6S3_9DIPT